MIYLIQARLFTYHQTFKIYKQYFPIEEAKVKDKKEKICNGWLCLFVEIFAVSNFRQQV